MSKRKALPNLNVKRLFSAIMCLLIALMFFVSQATHGFSVARLLFGALALYFSIAFFRTAKE